MSQVRSTAVSDPTRHAALRLFFSRGFLEVRLPLSSEFGTHTLVKARFWPRFEPFLVRKFLNPFMLFPLRTPHGMRRCTSSIPALSSRSVPRSALDWLNRALGWANRALVPSSALSSKSVPSSAKREQLERSVRAYGRGTRSLKALWLPRVIKESGILLPNNQRQHRTSRFRG